MRIRMSGPQKMLYCGNADAVKLRTTHGEIQILPGHAPYMAEIGKGRLEICTGENILTGETSAGIVYNHENEISIILFEPYKLS